MNRFLLNLSLVVALLITLIPFEGIAQTTYNFQHDNIEREYIFYQPADLEPNAPLVFVLHGYTSSAEIIMGYCEMNAVADENGFAVCYPRGTVAPTTGQPHWNANLTISTVDDIGFLANLATYLQSTFSLNPDHTFTCGMSNGGFMSYTLACERPDVFKAIASVTGTMSGYDWNNCDPSTVVPVFQISGVDDDVVPIDGSITTQGGWGGAPGLSAVTEFWVNKNQCTALTTSSTNVFRNTNQSYHTGGTNGNEVWQYLISNWGHSWPGSWSQTGIHASEEIWRFFQKVINGPTLNTAELSQTSIVEIYPNPGTSFIQIERKDLTQMDFELLSIEGKKLKRGILNHGNNRINISNLPKGIYILTLDGSPFKVLKE